MAELVILGVAASTPDAEHDTVGLLLRGPQGAVLVECGGSPLYKAARLGVDLEQIRAVILTHRHADHIYGLPILVQGMWIGGREAALPIYGPEETLQVARQLLSLFDLEEGGGAFPLEWRAISRRQGQRVLELNNVLIRAAPVEHGGLEVRALRFDHTVSGRSIVYSSDTRPCAALVDLAAGVDLLIQEASGAFSNHTSAAQAADLAREVGAAELALIHYPVRGVDPESLLREAAAFPGPVWLARDGDAYPL